MQTSALVRYLTLPLRAGPLLVIVVFTLLLALALRAGLFGIPLLMLIISWFFKYSFVLLDAVVEGRREPPVLAIEMMNPVEQRPLGTVFVIGAFYGLTVWLEPTIGAVATQSLRIGFLLLVPAMVAAMSINGRFIDGFNPVSVAALVARAPGAYLSLVVFIGLLWIVPYSLIRITVGWLVPGMYVDIGSSVPPFVLHALAMYLWLAMCACIGGMVYEHREDLDYEPVESPERTEAKHQAELDRERDKTMDGIFAQCRGNALANAGASVRKIIDESRQPLTEFRWLYARASKWPDQRLASYLVQYCLPMLLAARANGEALDLVRERLRVDADFRPLSAAHLLRMASLARDAGDKPTARALLRDFEQRFPNDPAAPLVAKLGAEIAR
jgi:hypothetical protein